MMCGSVVSLKMSFLSGLYFESELAVEDPDTQVLVCLVDCP